MKLDFNKTYNNVRFQVWEKSCSSEVDAGKFIDKLKSKYPKMIIVNIQRNISVYNEGGSVTITGMFTDTDTPISNDDFGGLFIDEFFKNEYSELDDLLSLKSLKYWYDLHKQHNYEYLRQIKSVYDNIINEYYVYNVGDFNSLNYKFDILESFNIISSDTDGLSSSSLNRLIKYNYIIGTFKQKFYDIKDEMKDRLETYKRKNLKSR